MKFILVLLMCFQVSAQNDIFELLSKYRFENNITITEFLEKNKSVIPKNWIPVFDSKSQFNVNVTPETPRFIRFNDKAKVIMTYGAHQGSDTTWFWYSKDNK